MCRFALYLGAEVPLSTLVTEPKNSIIHQSFHSHLREEPLNGDGFGVAWYPPHAAEAPALFKSTTPAWSNQNLRQLARATRTSCMLAHVRAASPGLPVTELNCHPFARGRLSFMHNGTVSGFKRLRRRLLASLSDEAFDAITGSTDSEHVLALLEDHLRSLDATGDATERLAVALERSVGSVEALRQELAPEETSQLNLVVCDGARAVVSRYSSDQSEGNSLYYQRGQMYVCDAGYCRMRQQGEGALAVIVASEPLDESAEWTEVAPDELVLVSPELDVTTRPMHPDFSAATANHEPSHKAGCDPRTTE